MKGKIKTFSGGQVNCIVVLKNTVEVEREKERRKTRVNPPIKVKLHRFHRLRAPCSVEVTDEEAA